jgi:apolipoprotein N-acyltransferase
VTGALLAAAAGVVLAAALPPAGWWPLILVLAIPFALTARTEGPRGAFTIGAAFAVGFFALYVAWLPLSFSAPSMLGPWFWLFHPFLLAILAAMWGATTALARLLGGRGTGTLLVLAPLWVVVEHLRSVGYFAFPWGTLGYAWLEVPVGQVADAIGVTGLSLLTTVAAALLAWPWVPPRTPPTRPVGARVLLPPLLGLATIGVAWLVGSAAMGRHEVPTNRTALLVQGNVDPFGRAASASQELDVHLELTRLGLARMAAPPDLVVWPEGALTGYELEGARGEEIRRALQAAAPHSAFVVGGRARLPGGSSNAAFSLADGQLLGRYDKHVLVPFGERWPGVETFAGAYRAVFGMLGLPLLASTVPGPGPAALGSGVGDLGVGICYESVFPTVMAGMVRDGAGALVIITNDAWFARGDGARQHLDMGRMRAIETRRWLLRAGNDGITAVVDPYGRVVAELDRMVAATLPVRFGTSESLTFYARHADRVPWAIAALVLIALPFARWGRP